MRVLLLFLLASCLRLHAQQDSTIIIKPGTSIHESLSITDLYLYPQFIYSKVFFKAGDSAMAKMNYHKYLDEMQFIDLKGDTLEIANAAMIGSIWINEDVFYYDQGYVRLLKDTKEIKLATKQALLLTGRNKIGPYDKPSPSASIDTYSSMYTEKSTYKIAPKEEIILTRKTLYYFGDKYNQFVLANRKNLLKKFSKQSAPLNAYLKENNVNFNSREDLEKLLQFLAAL